MQTEILSINDPKAISLAAEILAGGGLVVFPTDTVYGVGALAFNDQAVSKISDIKGRTGEKAIPILIGDFSQLALVSTGINSDCEKLSRCFWPGPLTIVLPRHDSIPDAVSPLQTVGVRIPDFTETIKLLKLTGPLAVSSANLAGMGSSSTARGVQSQLDGKIPLILDGGVTPGGIPSTVVDCSQGHPVILREGPISLKQILNALAQD
ncbi:MAG: L-threonylcarbamoyladenylate synthase [Chloroflexi bacterium]|nr:L-threonylcarbamoyladenylate synthase [Chloroflexota bacterium]